MVFSASLPSFSIVISSSIHRCPPLPLLVAVLKLRWTLPPPPLPSPTPCKQIPSTPTPPVAHFRHLCQQTYTLQPSINISLSNSFITVPTPLPDCFLRLHPAGLLPVSTPSNRESQPSNLRTINNDTSASSSPRLTSVQDSSLNATSPVHKALSSLRVGPGYLPGLGVHLQLIPRTERPSASTVSDLCRSSGRNYAGLRWRPRARSSC